jgi:tRNA-2-methylthio-N6-dimethylallyladenosine synthase
LLNNDLANESRKYTTGMVGETMEVLVTGFDEKSGWLAGHTEGRINTRIYSKNKKLIGTILSVKITSATDFSLAGEEVRINQPERVQ